MTAAVLLACLGVALTYVGCAGLERADGAATPRSTAVACLGGLLVAVAVVLASIASSP